MTYSANLSASGRKPACRSCKRLQSSPAPRRPGLYRRQTWPYRRRQAIWRIRPAALRPQASDVSFSIPLPARLRRISSLYPIRQRTRDSRERCPPPPQQGGFVALIASRLASPHVISPAAVTLFGVSPKGGRLQELGLRFSASGFPKAGCRKPPHDVASR